ncbi:T9SS type A sorting domain-containing protein, partial [candidate division KSB1 bacterium]|nr:T9SS type A sorting domain-containing protein [candidate division KSB1 bacterium]
APNALVELGSKAGFLGSICAKSIAIAKDARVRFHGLGAVPKLPSDDSEEEITSDSEPVTSYELAQNYPNPFNPTTTISFALPEAGEVSLSIYNLSGQLVKQLVAREMNAGRHNVVWDATDARGARVASGVYLYVIKTGEFTAQRKLVLLK